MPIQLPDTAVFTDPARAHPFVLQAYVAAATAHRDQKRKYTNESYIVHPLEVAAIVSTVTTDVDVIAAALLHDVVEDTTTTLADIHAQFGARVAELVDFCTHRSRPEHGNRRTRKVIDNQHYASGPADSQTIKVADMLSNVPSIQKYDPEFASVYVREKRDLLNRLAYANWDLRERARTMLYP